MLSYAKIISEVVVMKNVKKNEYKKPNWFIYFLYRMASKFLAKFIFNTKIRFPFSMIFINDNIII